MQEPAGLDETAQGDDTERSSRVTYIGTYISFHYNRYSTVPRFGLLACWSAICNTLRVKRCFSTHGKSAAPAPRTPPFLSRRRCEPSPSREHQVDRDGPLVSK
jgi:hypothetical protein